jgi:transposase
MQSARDFKKVFIHRDPVDMRRGINGLSEIVQSTVMGDLMQPHLFVFTGRKRDSIKVLYFDRSGFALWQKRLEMDKFPWPKRHTDLVVQLTPEQFSWLLDGYDVWKIKPFSELHFEKVS